jgi:hypothetical protein
VSHKCAWKKPQRHCLFTRLVSKAQFQSPPFPSSPQPKVPFAPPPLPDPQPRLPFAPPYGAPVLKHVSNAPRGGALIVRAIPPLLTEVAVAITNHPSPKGRLWSNTAQ